MTRDPPRPTPLSPILLAFAAWFGVENYAPGPLGPQRALAQAPADPLPPPIVEPAHREVRTFDFEEKDRNPLPVPAGWYRAQDDPAIPRDRPGFPFHNAATLDYDGPARGGVGSLALPTRGGSTSLRLAPGVVTVFPGSDYQVTAHVRTDDARHARFRMTVVFLDQRSNEIASSRVSTEPLAPGPGWTPVSATLLGSYPDAAFLQIDLELVQPREYEPSFLGEHHVYDEDLHATIHVDDVRVTQLPRVELSTTSPANIVAAPDPVEFRLLVRDLVEDNLTARTVVRDARGAVVFESTRPILSVRAPMRVLPTIDAYGWYRARTSLLAGERTVATATADFVYLPAPPDDVPTGSCSSDPDDRRRFAIAIDAFRAADLGSFEKVVRNLNVGGITLGLWDAPSPPNARALDDALGMIDTGWHDLGFAINAPPPSVVSPGLTPPTVLELLGDRAESAPIEIPLLPLLDRFGQSVRRWRLGAIGSDGQAFIDGFAERLDRAVERLSSLVPGPQVTLAWKPYLDLELTRESRQLAGIDVAFAAGTGSDPVAAFARQWKRVWQDSTRRAPEVRYSIEAAPDDRFGPRAVAAEFVRRAAEVWAAHAREGELDEDACPREIIELARPWKWAGARRPQVVPAPEVAALRTAIDHFRDRRVTGELEIAPGIRCLMLTPAPYASPDRGGCLVAWSESLGPQTARLFLGDGDVRVVDIFSNVVDRLEPRPWDESDPETRDILVHDLTVTDEPVFVEGIDVELTSFIASFRLVPDFLESGYDAHLAAIAHDNPWPGSISGSVSVISPGGGVGAERDRSWSFNPRVSRFNVSQGVSNEIPIEIAFSPVQEAGRVPLVLDVDLVAPGAQRRVRVVTFFDVGLEGVELDVKYFPIPGTNDATLEAIVSNTGTEPRSLELLANVPGFPRLRAGIDDIEPGASIVRRFTLTDAQSKVRGQKAYIGAVDRARNARLNRSVDLR